MSSTGPRTKPASAQPKPELHYLDLQSWESKRMILVQGPPGSGKTHFGSTFPEPTFIIFDRNTGSLEKYTRDRKDVRVLPCLSFPEWVQKLRPAIDAREVLGQSLIFDGFNLFAERAATWLASTKLGQQQPGSELDRLKQAPILSGYEDWNRYKSVMRQFGDHLAQARRLRGDHPGYHILVTCHTQTVTNEKGDVVGVFPAIDSNLKESLAGWFDAAFRAKQSVKRHKTPGQPDRLETVYRLEVIKDGIGGGNTTIPALPHELPNHFDAVMGAWEGAGQAERK